MPWAAVSPVRALGDLFNFLWAPPLCVEEARREDRNRPADSQRGNVGRMTE